MNLPGDKLSQQTAEVGYVGRDTIKYITAVSGLVTFQMTTQYRSYHVVTTNNYAMAMTLPKAADMPGQMIFVYAETIDASDNLTILAAADDPNFGTVTCAESHDRVILISDGVHWFAIDGGVATGT